MRLLPLTVSWLFVISACATTAPAPTPKAEEPVMAKAMYPGDDTETTNEEEEPDIICKMEKVTGSAIKKKVCTTRAQRKAMRKSAEGFIRQGQRAARPNVN